MSVKRSSIWLPICAGVLGVIVMMTATAGYTFDPLPGVATGKESADLEPIGVTDPLDDVMEEMAQELDASIEALEAEAPVLDTSILVGSQGAGATLGENTRLRQEIYRMERLVELYERRHQLRQLMRAGAADGEIPSVPGAQSRSDWERELDEPGLSGFGDFLSPAQAAPPMAAEELPLVSRVYSNSQGLLAAQLIYRTGDVIPGAVVGTRLPSGERVRRVSMTGVVVSDEEGEEIPLRFVPRHLAR